MTPMEWFWGGVLTFFIGVLFSPTVVYWWAKSATVGYHHGLDEITRDRIRSMFRHGKDVSSESEDGE